jgi:hypothetical protein
MTGGMNWHNPMTSFRSLATTDPLFEFRGIARGGPHRLRAGRELGRYTPYLLPCGQGARRDSKPAVFDLYNLRFSPGVGASPAVNRYATSI